MHLVCKRTNPLSNNEGGRNIRSFKCADKQRASYAMADIELSPDRLRLGLQPPLANTSAVPNDDIHAAYVRHGQIASLCPRKSAVDRRLGFATAGTRLNVASIIFQHDPTSPRPTAHGNPSAPF